MEIFDSHINVGMTVERQFTLADKVVRLGRWKMLSGIIPEKALALMSKICRPPCTEIFNDGTLPVK